jgi:hypothetical protein
MFHDVSVFSAYRINVDAVAGTQLTKILSWTLRIIDRYLAQLVAGRKNNDLIYTIAIGASFAQ